MKQKEKSNVSLFFVGFIVFAGVLYLTQNKDTDNTDNNGVEVVIAHYDEDLTWIDRANDLRYTIYSKSSDPPEGTSHLPNLGRESQTFLYHIVSNYNSLADWTVFTQAAAPTFGFKANNHNSGHLCSGVTWDNYIKSNKEGWYEVQTVATRYPEMWHSDRFEMMFMMPTSDGGVCPSEGESGWSMWWSEEDHPLLKKQKTDGDFVEPVEFYNRYVVANASDKTYESFTLNYANGGRFAVSRERILMRPLSYYMDLLNELSKNINPIEGYYMETMWYDVFHPERLQAEYGTVCSVPDIPSKGATNHASMFDKSLSGYNDFLVETYGSIEAAPRDLEASRPYLISGTDLTNAPTNEPSNEPTHGTPCFDDLTWHDTDATTYDCSWYSKSVSLYSKDVICGLYGESPDANGKTANEACCACGGGTVEALVDEVELVEETPIPTPENASRVFVKIHEKSNEMGVAFPFHDESSYQYQAYKFVEDDLNSITYSDEKIIQRYALACYYFGTNAVKNEVTTRQMGDATPPGWHLDFAWATHNSECVWFGIRCNDEYLVTEIVMPGNRMTGVLPPEISFLSQSLHTLDLFNNTYLQAGLGTNGNAWLGQLSNLRRLYHAFCKFESHTGIPTEIGTLSNLEEYDCAFNLYFGALQGSSFSNLNNLVFLDISGGVYESGLPEELLSLPRLEDFFMSDSFVQADVSYVTRLQNLYQHFADYNQGISGHLPEATSLGVNLEMLSFSHCSLVGTIPNSYGNLPAMERLYLNDNNIDGTLPSELGNLSKLQKFEIQGNHIRGTVPSELGRLTNLEKFQLESNDISGTMPEEVCGKRYTGPLGVGSIMTLTADCGPLPEPIDIICDCCTQCHPGSTELGGATDEGDGGAPENSGPEDARIHVPYIVDGNNGTRRSLARNLRGI